MNVSMPLAAQGSAAVAHLFDGEKRPEVKEAEQRAEAARQAVEAFERRLSDTDSLLKMKRQDRLDNCNMPELKAAVWDKNARVHSAIAAHLVIIGAAVGGTVAMFGLGWQGLPVLASMAACGPGVAYGYVKGIKHLVLPRLVDRAVVPALTRERDSLQSALQQARTAHGEAESKLNELIQADLASVDLKNILGTQPAAIKVDEATVTVGGVRIPVRRRQF
ncbi:MAG: hypothetical protein AB1758_10875 [Candidatus Eremiobacterota bacterium]